MTGLGDVFGSLQAMTQLQLLLAFIACIGYAFAQGSLLAQTGRRLAWSATTFASIGFAVESTDWTHAIVLLGFAVAGMGTFVAVVWLTSHALGFSRSTLTAPSDAFESSATALVGPDTRPRAPLPGDHAHSI